MRCDQTPAWAQLLSSAEAFAGFDLRQAFAQDAGRAAYFSQEAPGVFADLSKNHWDANVQTQLLDLLDQTGVLAQRDRMFQGQAINNTEDRAVMHWLLRHPEDGATFWPSSMRTALKDVHLTLNAMLAFAEQVRSNSQITDVVNIGIGGSDLGPQMAVLAMQAYAQTGKRFHFISNVDGHELDAVLRGLKAHSTMFLVASKTFTTLETMTNALSAKRWFEAQGGTDVSAHFAALTTNVEAAAKFGIETCFGFWDWVGGRYSLWSAIGLPLAMATGSENFRAFLAGGHAMDQHFQSADAPQNLPIRLGLLDVWYRNFLNYTSRCLAPYHSALKRFPAYLQQLEMESNGKQVDRAGQRLHFGTAPVLWGEPGTNGQHAFFQMLHQGSDVVPLEFVAVKNAVHPLPDHQALLLSNALAQAQALMLGQTDAGGHKNFPGNRPSSFIVLEDLTPFNLGALIALQEHRVFVSGAVWGINSFDQWGVELGKVLAKDIHARLISGNAQGLDASTAQLLKRLR
ncbi:MAG: glucose-6-phosphate isomerase [Betaproteobacteria bacterium]|jgi:glucose-6-phosphate isomerase|nr:glucose-6-phosphate isomerase [Burkholderiales bacterium]NBX13668.1 glucose-6-phosphate isomerase [Betaproteobacteria bacterium]